MVEEAMKNNSIKKIFHIKGTWRFKAVGFLQNIVIGIEFMNSSFWSNTVWYILLGITIVIELLAIFLKAQNRKRVLAFYLAVSGFAFSLEMVVYSFLKGYQYFPMLMPQSPPDDSIAGNLFSQFSVCATALFIAVFKLKYYWYFIFAAVYGAIEELFVYLGIYKQYWYRTWMTLAGLLVLFWMVNKIYDNTIKRVKPFWRYLYVYFGLVTLHENTVIWTQRLAGIRMYSETFLPDKERSLVVLSAINNILLAAAIMTAYYSIKKWRWKLPVILPLYAVNYIAANLNLIIYKEGWFLISSSICIWSMYLFTYILDKLINGNDISSVEFSGKSV
jgi:hypothetical protein